MAAAAAVAAAASVAAAAAIAAAVAATVPASTPAADGLQSLPCYCGFSCIALVSLLYSG